MPYGEPLSDARTPLADFFRILLYPSTALPAHIRAPHLMPTTLKGEEDGSESLFWFADRSTSRSFDSEISYLQLPPNREVAQITPFALNRPA